MNISHVLMGEYILQLFIFFVVTFLTSVSMIVFHNVERSIDDYHMNIYLFY